MENGGHDGGLDCNWDNFFSVFRNRINDMDDSGSLYIGLDIGTQSTKCLVLNNQNEVVARTSQSYTIMPSDIRGRCEQHPSTWIEAVIAVVNEAMHLLGGPSASSRVKSVAVSGQQHGMVVLDDSGMVLRPCKLWCDTESSAEAEELSQLSQTGVFPFKLGPSFTVTKLLWLKRHEPDKFAKATRLLLPASYLNFWLTGIVAMDAGDASGTGLLNITSKQWDEHYAKAVDEKVLRMLPKISGPDEPISSSLTLEASRALFGFDHRADIIVGGGSGDNACSALGCGLLHPNQLVVSLGTSGTLFAFSDEPIIDPSGAVAAFVDATGHWLPLICTLNCTSVLSEIRDGMGQDHEELTRLAAQIPPGCDGTTFLPFLIGERTPNWPNSSGVLYGIKPGLFRSPGLIYRAAMEGITYCLLAGFRSMKMKDGDGGSEICLVGGGSRNPLWQQMIADVFQMRVRVPSETESAAFGAALQGAALYHKTPIRSFIESTMGARSSVEIIVHPQTELAKTFEESFERYYKLSRLLFEER